MKLEKMFEKKLEDIEKLKEEEGKSASQERQANITSLKEKATKLKELSSAWQRQFETAGERIKEFKKASGDVTKVFDKYKGKGLIEEKTRQEFIKTVKESSRDEDSSDEEANEVEIRDQKMGEVKQAALTIAELRKAIKEALPEEIAKSINFSLKAVDKENVGDTIERAVFGIEREIKNLVKEGVVEWHKKGSVVVSPEDERDMKTLGRKEVEDIILDQANNFIETKRAKDLAEVAALEKDIQDMLAFEQSFEGFWQNIQTVTGRLEYKERINESVARLSNQEEKSQLKNDLDKIAEEFRNVFSESAIMSIFTNGNTKRSTNGIRNEIILMIRGSHEKFSEAIWDKTYGLQKQGEELKNSLIELKEILAETKNEAHDKLLALQKRPDQEKYIINPQAEKLLSTKDKWGYLDKKKENINIIANSERALAKASLNENFLALENRAAEAENGKVYDTVEDYRYTVKELKNKAKEAEEAMGARYRDEFSIRKEEPFLTMPRIDNEIKEWEKSKEGEEGKKGKNELKKKQEAILEKYSGWLNSKTHKKEIETATKEIAKLTQEINDIDNKIKEIKATGQQAREKIAIFLRAIPKKYLDNEKFAKEIYKEYNGSGALTNVVSSMEHFPKNFGIISGDDVVIHRELGWQRETLKKAEQARKQAEESLAKAQTQAANFEKDYLGA